MQEGVHSAVPRTVTRKKTGSTSDHQEEDIGRAVAESLPKNLIAAHPVQGSLADEGSGGTCSPATEMKDFLFYACGREGERQRRNSGVGETVTGAINSPPPSRRETPIIIWIKSQNLATPARPLACLPATPRPRPG